MNPGCGSVVKLLHWVIPLKFIGFRVQRTLCTQSHQCTTEQNVLRSESKTSRNPAPVDTHAGRFLKKNLLVSPCVSNIIPPTTTTTKNDQAVHQRIQLLICTFQKDEEMSTAVIFFSLVFQNVQWGTVQHKAVFLQPPSIYQLSNIFHSFGQWNGTCARTHTHTKLCSLDI